MLFRPILFAKAAAFMIVSARVGYVLLVDDPDSKGNSNSSSSAGVRGLEVPSPPPPPQKCWEWWSDFKVTAENPNHEAALKELLRRFGTTSVAVEDIDEIDEVDWDDVKDALGIQLLSEVDGLPIPVDGYDTSLFLGTIGAAYNLDGLLEKGITHIVSVSRSARTNYPDKFQYLNVNVSGSRHTHKTSNKMMDLFESTSAFISQAMHAGGKVLVHDYGGEGRSAAFISAYLMKYNSLTSEEALSRIKRNRPTVRPTEEFVDNLSLWEKIIGNKGDISMETDAFETDATETVVEADVTETDATETVTNTE